METLKVLVEGAWAGTKNVTGIGRYGLCLARELEKLSNGIEYSSFALAGKKRLIYLSLMKWLLSPPIELLIGEKGDFVLFTEFVCLPHFKRMRSVVVVYDLSFIKCPQYAPSRTVKYLSRFVPMSIAEAEHIIVISEAMKSEITETYG